MRAAFLLLVCLGCFILDSQGQVPHKRYGDMLLTKRQEEIFIHPDINERKAINALVRRWTNNVVPYIYAPNATQNRPTIEQGLDLWRENTCLEIVEDKKGTFAKQPHIRIGNLDEGCYSHVGMVKSEIPQELNLGDGCILVDTAAHEFGHSLGLFHEQGRTDRDNYVTILKDNVDDENHSQFDLEINSDDYGTPYDYTSVMHYAAYDFSKNDEIVIVPKDPFQETIIGTVPTPSYIDYLIMNKMYKCEGNCRKTSCSNGFPTTVKGKCKCICKAGYSGAKCEKKEPVKPSLCPNTEIKTSGAVITSPSWPKPFPKDLNCMWLITAPKGKKIQLEAEKFHIHPKGKIARKCNLDFLRVRYGDITKGGKTEWFCDEMLTKQTFNSNQAFLVFHSVTNNMYPGFKIKVNFV